jgi:hypothetical protein
MGSIEVWRAASGNAAPVTDPLVDDPPVGDPLGDATTPAMIAVARSMFHGSYCAIISSQRPDCGYANPPFCKD